MYKTLTKFCVALIAVVVLAQSTPNAGAAETWQIQGIKIGNPMRVEIPRLGVNLPITRGHYNTSTKKWSIGENSAYFSGNSLNNVGGQTVVYAHNWKGLFARIPEQKKGDTVDIYSENGLKFVYTLRQQYETSPQNGSIYQYSGPSRLVLITCAGPNDSRRLIQIYEPTKID